MDKLETPQFIDKKGMQAMTQRYELLRYEEPHKSFRRLSDGETLISNVETLKRNARVMSAKVHELSKLFEETQQNLADTRSLRIKLNKLALKLGLEPLGAKKTKR